MYHTHSKQTNKQKSWSDTKEIKKKDFKTSIVPRDKERHLILIKVSIHKKDITMRNIHAPNNRVSKEMKTDGIGETDN